MRFPDFGDIGTDSVIVGDIHVAIAAQVAVPVEFIAAKELASGQLADRGGREAQRCEVEAQSPAPKPCSMKRLKETRTLPTKVRENVPTQSTVAAQFKRWKGCWPPWPGPLKTPLSLRSSVRLF